MELFGYILAGLGGLVAFNSIRERRALYRKLDDALEHAHKWHDELIMSRQVVAELVPKAKAWDYLQQSIKETKFPPLDLPLPGGQVEADLERYRISYQHLSAECDGCEETPTPRRRRSDKLPDQMWDYR